MDWPLDPAKCELHFKVKWAYYDTPEWTPLEDLEVCVPVCDRVTCVTV